MALGKVENVRLQGVEFGLSGEDLSSGTRGVGNKSISSEVSISHDGGDLLFIWEENADLLVWDGMFTQKEITDKKGWGHSSIEQAIDFNVGANCKKILITHHAPSRSDKELDRISKGLPELFMLARDGLEMEV